jgi:hypothetical protein
LRVNPRSMNETSNLRVNLNNKEMLEKNLFSNLYFWYFKTFQ